MWSDREWLKTLKVGDEVAYNNGNSFTGKNYVIDKIIKITPSGRIKTQTGKEFNNTGEIRGSNGSWFCLEPVTKEIVDFIERRRLVFKLREVKFEKLSAEQLRAVYEIVGGENNDTETL